jgi:hypothetical protein
LLKVDHGRPPIARIAVHVLEQVQRRAAATVEGVDIARFRFERIAALHVDDQREDSIAMLSRQHRVA